MQAISLGGDDAGAHVKDELDSNGISPGEAVAENYEVYNSKSEGAYVDAEVDEHGGAKQVYDTFDEELPEGEAIEEAGDEDMDEVEVEVEEESGDALKLREVALAMMEKTCRLTS
jgi:hypothetical protein